MKLNVRRHALALMLVLGITTVAPAAYADPAADTGLQTAVCDNGETYVFSLREVGSDRSQASGHTPVHDPASNAVATLITSTGTVTIDDGESIQSFPFSTGRLRSEKSGHLTTCTSTFDVWNGPVHVHVESTDVVHISGRR